MLPLKISITRFWVINWVKSLEYDRALSLRLLCCVYPNRQVKTKK